MKRFCVTLTAVEGVLEKEVFVEAEKIVPAIQKAVDQMRGIIEPDQFYSIQAKEYKNKFAWIVRGKLVDGYFHQVFSSKEKAEEWMSKWARYDLENVKDEGFVDGEYGTLIRVYETFSICKHCGKTMFVGGYIGSGLCEDCYFTGMEG